MLEPYTIHKWEFRGKYKRKISVSEYSPIKTSFQKEPLYPISGNS